MDYSVNARGYGGTDVYDYTYGTFSYSGTFDPKIKRIVFWVIGAIAFLLVIILIAIYVLFKRAAVNRKDATSLSSNGMQMGISKKIAPANITERGDRKYKVTEEISI